MSFAAVKGEPIMWGTFLKKKDKKSLGIIIFFIFSFLFFIINFADSYSPSSSSMPAGYEGVHIEIDKTTNRLFLYLNNILIKTFPVATGKNASLTPEGSFEIVTKVVNPWYLPKKIPGGDKKNPLGTRWLGLNVPNTGGYKYGIHGTNNPYSIGRHVSLGCIRMQNKDVEWLYRHIPIKTPVIIRSSQPN